MIKLTSFSDFINNDDNSDNRKPIVKPYIYVIKYIMGKDDYVEELKEYISNYNDEESVYEDGDSYDPFMFKLKELVEEDNIDEIEEMILNYEDYELDVDYDEDDDDFEERMYNKDYVEDDTENQIYDDEVEEIETEFETIELSDKLKDFLKIDIEFEDLVDDDEYFEIEGEEDEFKDAEYVDYEEIVEDEQKEENTDEIKNDERPDYLDKLPLFPHTSDGEPLNEEQLDELIEIVKDDTENETKKGSE